MQTRSFQKNEGGSPFAMCGLGKLLPRRVWRGDPCEVGTHLSRNMRGVAQNVCMLVRCGLNTKCDGCPPGKWGNSSIVNETYTRVYLKARTCGEEAVRPGILWRTAQKVHGNEDYSFLVCVACVEGVSNIRGLMHLASASNATRASTAKNLR